MQDAGASAFMALGVLIGASVLAAFPTVIVSVNDRLTFWTVDTTPTLVSLPPHREKVPCHALLYLYNIGVQLPAVPCTGDAGRMAGTVPVPQVG